MQFPSLTLKFQALDVGSAAQTISISNASASASIVGPVKTLILLLQIISCNIIQTGLMAQFELCHAMHQFYFHLAFFFLNFHPVAEILQPSELAFLFSPDFQLCSD